MTERAPKETEEQFADRLLADLSHILGTGIILEELNLRDADDTPTHIKALCLLDAGSELLEAAGATRLEAYNRLIKAAAELRLAIAWRNMIAPT
jgi:hypothetical protein